MDNYRFERLSVENLHHLVYLYKQCFNYKVSFDFLKRKYKTDDFGASFIGFIAFSNSTSYAAAYYGVFPIICEQNGKRILAAQSGDTMTHPNHQGQGLFTKLAKATYELAKKEGISFVFGFPNKNSYPGFVKKLDWKHYGDINNYVIKTGALPFDKLAKKIPLLGTLYRGYVNKRLKPLLQEEYFENSLLKQNPDLGCIVHNTQFFKYKKYNETYCVKINNTRCIIKLDGRMWVGDVEFCSENEFVKVLDNLKVLAKKLRCASIQFSVFNESFYDKILKGSFEVKTQNPVGFLNLVGNAVPENFAYQAVDFDTY